MKKKYLPYNTGKVLIGGRYAPPKRSCMSDIDIFWQCILLGEKRPTVDVLITWVFKGVSHA
jgi:hypothetical protein